MQPVTEQWRETLRDGTVVLIRPINTGDAERERTFIEGLSPESQRYRFFNEIHHPTPALIKQLTDIDQIKQVALVAVTTRNNTEEQIGVSRYSVDADGRRCECTVVVGDAWQHKGLGKLLMDHLIEIARQRGIEEIYSIDLASNHQIQELAKCLGFQSRRDPDDATQMIHYRKL